MGNEEIIGRVLLTRREPAGPFEFWVWIGSGEKGTIAKDVEISSLIVAESPDGKEKIIGVVEDIQNRTAVEDHLAAFYSSGYGDPKVEPPVAYPTVSVLKTRVLYRQQTRVTPPDSAWHVRYANESDIDLLSMQTPENKRIPLGLLQIRPDPAKEESWIPLFGNAEYIFGTQAAHMNISGMTGLATKTSYALFVVLCAASWAKKNNIPFMAVLFNVKHDDFINLDKLPESWEEAKSNLRRWGQNFGGGVNPEQNVAMWERLRKWVDPLEISIPIKYFTYKSDKYKKRFPEWTRQNPYSYGLSDVGVSAVLSGVFGEKEEETSPQLALLDQYMRRLEQDVSLVKNGKSDKSELKSYKDLLEDLQETRKKSGREVTTDYVGEDAPIQKSSVGALLRKVNTFINRAEAILVRDRPQGIPITFGQLEKKGVNVVQLHGLPDEAQRLVFNAVIRDIERGLEEERNRREALSKDQKDSSSKELRVVVVIDELNKFAPKFGSSPVKEGIRDMVQRGRDLRMVLFGAEQYASQIDPGVYGNPGTEVIGRTKDGELSQSLYSSLGELKRQIPLLPKGKMLVNHAIYPSSTIIAFPPLLHRVKRDLEQEQ